MIRVAWKIDVIMNMFNHSVHEDDESSLVAGRDPGLDCFPGARTGEEHPVLGCAGTRANRFLRAAAALATSRGPAGAAAEVAGARR